MSETTPTVVERSVEPHAALVFASGILTHRRYRFAPLIVGLGVLALAIEIFEPGFYRTSNLHIVLQEWATLGIVTLGQLLVLLVGGIDLSVGAVMNASLIIIALLDQHNDHLLWLALVVSIAVGAGVGLVNGILVAYRDVPPFAATLGMLAVVQGGILVYTKGVPAGQIPASLRPVALHGIGIVPYSFLICLGIAAAMAFVLRRGTYGRKIYAVGRSPEAAWRAAISTNGIRLSAYVACGVLAALAGIILSAFVGYVDPEIGGNYNLESIAAAVLGGVAFTGGEGGVIGALVGALFLLSLLNVFTLSSLNPYTQLIVEGIALLVAVALFQGLKQLARQSHT